MMSTVRRGTNGWSESRPCKKRLRVSTRRRSCTLFAIFFHWISICLVSPSQSDATEYGNTNHCVPSRHLRPQSQQPRYPEKQDGNKGARSHPPYVDEAVSLWVRRRRVARRVDRRRVAHRRRRLADRATNLAVSVVPFPQQTFMCDRQTDDCAAPPSSHSLTGGRRSLPACSQP
ncbi:hypothetical protein LZ31DRAFT_185642 [Colletotrichum somersetense]|nr:hypothetical protein LZ31DRAFT_185642 [Colletotrichum somersetense]